MGVSGYIRYAERCERDINVINVSGQHNERNQKYEGDIRVPSMTYGEWYVGDIRVSVFTFGK